MKLYICKFWRDFNQNFEKEYIQSKWNKLEPIKIISYNIL